jgi:hypothetical protein
MRFSAIALAVTLVIATPWNSTLAADEGNAGGTQDAGPRVTYLVGGSVYIDAGQEMGLAEGSTVEVYRNGATVAILKVQYVSPRRASCSIVSSEVEIQVGDAVRLPESPGLPPPLPAESPVVTSAPGGENQPRQGSWGRSLGLRGRIGGGYLTVRDQSGVGEDFSQPSLDVNLAGTRLGGSDFDLAVDLRSRRTYRTHTDGETSDYGQTRAYRLSAAWQRPGSSLRVAAGRQMSPKFASVSLFDGLLVEYLKPRTSFGVFAGSQPDPVTYGFSSEIMEYGAYAQWRERPGSSLHWSLAGGAIASYASGTSNREYLFFRAQTSAHRFYGYASQEIDWNRGWKSQVEATSLSLTSTYLNLRYQIDPRFSVYGGYDNRRRVRLYRDRETRESEFDDSYRQGLLGGVDARVLRPLRMGLGVSHQVGEPAGNARSYTLSLNWLVSHPTVLELATRHTRYLGPWVEGWLNSFSLSHGFGSRLDAGLYGGIRSETRNLAIATTEDITWWGMSLDLGLARGWYLLITGERTNGAEEDNSQIYTNLSYRF